MSFRGKLLKYSKKLKWAYHVCVEIAFKGGEVKGFFLIYLKSVSSVFLYNIIRKKVYEK